MGAKHSCCTCASGKVLDSTKKKAIPWDRDSVDGGSSSMEIVLNWLSNYQRWRGDLEEGKTKKLLCSEIIEVMKENRIHHQDLKGCITQEICDLQSSYKTACYWKSNAGVGILDDDSVNGVKTVDGKLMMCSDQIHFLCRYWDYLDPSMGSSSVAEPLHTQSSVLVPIPEAHNLKRKKKKEETIKRTKEGKRKKKDRPREELYMKSVITKRKAEMKKAHASATKAKVSYMRELRELDLQYKGINTLLDKEFPLITDALSPSDSEEYNSDLD
ncbi:uncharacterized protein VP01_128g1 [Puccinia sorghi]|uniref:Uncharacterized protein n=1 Tax=Puccinia sorghi TaxID=27349 RepID=A0A0L6VNK4_9BASI|nr:uncharacterized protein VP01_128g1 [Puccinia sorghi]